MGDAVIVSTARTPIGKAYRGAFNDTEAPALGGHVVKTAVVRAGVDPQEVDDVILGLAAPQGTQGYNIGRLSAIAAGLPDTVSGMQIDRMCSSGMIAIGLAAKTVMTGEQDIVVAGGLESVSLTQNKHKNSHRAVSKAVLDKSPHMYMPMIETAEVVADRYDISREAQDKYALQSQQRTAEAQEAGRFDDEIVPLTSVKSVFNKETKEVTYEEVTLTRDEGNRPGTSLDNLAALEPVYADGSVVKQGKHITAGNASQSRILLCGRGNHSTRYCRSYPGLHCCERHFVAAPPVWRTGKSCCIFPNREQRSPPRSHGTVRNSTKSHLARELSRMEEGCG